MSSTTPELKFTTFEEIDEVGGLYTPLSTKPSGRARLTYCIQKGQILQLAYLVQDNLERFKEAFAIDLGRPPHEAAFLELNPTISDCKIAYDRLLSIKFAAFRPVIRKEPKGVVVHHGLIAELIPKYLDNDVVRVVLGGVPETTKLMEYQWGHVLYTGNGRVGRLIGIAAAKTLSPISLELGGKSPVVIDAKCDFKIAARRIMWGRCVNAGQTCIAPDYVLVPFFRRHVHKGLKDAHDEFYPSGAVNTPDISISSTLRFHHIRANPAYMPVDDVDAAIAYINAHDHPLALYCFSSDAAFKNKVANDVLLQAAPTDSALVDGLPFGGIGPSGSGYRHRSFSFDMIDNILGGRFPPYTVSFDDLYPSAFPSQ
ncbi:Aldehyde/histidinol dehydrogenase [Suillus spraguei]|nr:Aldehyde/histidinol dehydrogenase [Suillus spraguei]